MLFFKKLKYPKEVNDVMPSGKLALFKKRLIVQFNEITPHKIFSKQSSQY